MSVQRWRYIPDKYLAMICWFILLALYVVLFWTGHESKLIESMLSTAFGAFMMGLQIGFKRLESSMTGTRDRHAETREGQS